MVRVLSKLLGMGAVYILNQTCLCVFNGITYNASLASTNLYDKNDKDFKKRHTNCNLLKLMLKCL